MPVYIIIYLSNIFQFKGDFPIPKLQGRVAASAEPGDSTLTTHCEPRGVPWDASRLHGI